MNWSRRRDANARSWVFAILHNLAVNRIRQETRRVGTVTIEEMPEATGALAAGQEQNLFGQDVLAAIERLPPDYRSILLLISVEDLTYAEAATVLDVPIGTVMSRLSRAREQLKLILETRPEVASIGGPFIRRVK
jgi:RNA polymerase sigma-70 factor (ECF subfamily)